MKDKLTIVAETLVNQRFMRNGSPAFKNPLDMLPKKFKVCKEFIEIDKIT